MPKPPPRFKKPDAMDLFTDRVSEQEVLRRVMMPTGVQPVESVRLVTSFYGVGGVGKTTLCRRALDIAKREFPTGATCVHTSFDDQRWTVNTSFASVAAELSRVLRQADISTELTSSLLAVWDQSAGEAGGMEEKWQLALEAADKIIEATNLPGVSLIVKGAIYLRDQARRASIRKRLHELDLWPTEVGGRVTQLEVERKLPLAMFHDVQSWLHRAPGRELRVLLDGFERIQGKEDRQDAQRGLQEWIGYFAFPTTDERTVGGKVRFAIFGREHLRWDEVYHDEDWSSHWEQHLLGGLAENDARTFLRKGAEWRRSNGQDAAADRILAMQDRILNAADEGRPEARAFYPYSLDLAVDMIDRAEGVDLDLGRTPADLQERFLRYLRPREKRALMILAIAEVFDEDLFNKLAAARLIDYPRHTFRTEILTGRSYIQEIAGREGDFRFHRKMEEALQKAWLASAKAREEGRQIVHSLLEHHRHIIGDNPPRLWDERQFDAWRRAVEVIVTQGPELGLLDTDEWLAMLAQEPWACEHYTLLEDRLVFLSRIASACESRLGERHEVSCLVSYRKALHLSEAGCVPEAMALHRRVFDMRLELLGRGHRHTLESGNAVARLMSDEGHFAEAEPLSRSLVAECEEFLGHDDPETLQAHHNLGILLQSRGYLVEAQASYTRALDGRRAVLGPMHHDTLKTMNNLGNVLKDRNLLEASEAMYRGALQAKEAALGPAHPSTLKTVHNLAGLLEERCHFDVAESMLRRALHGFVTAYGATHPDSIDAISRLAWFQFDRGRAAEALTLCDQAIADRIDAEGDDQLGVVRLRQSKAKILSEMEMTAPAIELFQQVLASLERLLGLTHPDTLDALDDVANVLAAQGRFSQAEPLYRRAIEGLMATRGRQHPETLACRVRLAHMLQRGAVRLDEAEAICRDIVSERERSLGPTHRDTLDAVDDLACFLTQRNRHAEAEELFQHAADGLTATLGEGHPDTLSCRRRLAALYQHHDRFEQAGELFQDVLAIAISTRGQLHPYTLDVVDDLAGLFAAQGDYRRAEEYYDRAASGLAATLGADHPTTLKARVRLATMLQHGPEQLERAEAIFSEVHDARERLFGATHPTTLDSIDDLAGLFAARGDYDRAEEYYDRAVSGLLATFGADHPETLKCRVHLARMLQHGPEQLDRAEAIFFEVLAARERLFGATHPTTLDSIDDLAGLFAVRGEYGRAEEYYEGAASGLAATLGADHPQTLECRIRLAGMLQKVPVWLDKAEASYRDILARRDKSLGAAHPDTLETLKALALLLRQNDRQAVALSLLRQWHSRSASCADAVRYNLACDESAAGNLEEARRLILEELQKHPERRQLALENESLLAIRGFIEQL